MSLLLNTETAQELVARFCALGCCLFRGFFVKCLGGGGVMHESGEQVPGYCYSRHVCMNFM